MALYYEEYAGIVLPSHILASLPPVNHTFTLNLHTSQVLDADLFIIP